MALFLAIMPEKPPEALPASADVPEIYTLISENGGVSVYSGGRVVSTAEIDLSLLREADADMLRRGVSVATWEEAVGLLEDFSS